MRISAALLCGLTAAVAGLVVGCATPERATIENHRGDEEAIKKVIVEMTDAFNRHEPDTSLFTQDADFVNVNGTWLKGRAEIEQGRKVRFETVLKEARIRLLSIRVRFIRPDVAIVHVTNESRGMVLPSRARVPAQQELKIRVLTKEDGRWVVAAFHNTSVR
jgi:uncharacterized protein (TIGR02246 family)